MYKGAFLSALAAWYLFGLGTACPFHSQGEADTHLNNIRRSPISEPTTTALQGVRVFNGHLFTRPQTVCLDGGYIVDAQHCDDGGASQVVDGAGKYLVPGLIDAHIHLRDVASLEKFTSYGCTTAMHMNCGNYTQCAIMAEQPGLAAFLRAGYSSVGNGSAHAAMNPNRPNDTFIYPDTDVEQFVQWQFGNGSDFHKITAEIHGPSLEQQIEMVRVAHEQFGRQTMTHASTVVAYGDAATSITDAVQHVPDDGLLGCKVIRTLRRQGQYVTPTLNIFRYAYNNPLLPLFFGIKPGSNRTLENAEANAKLLYEAGVPLIAGTDAVGVIPINGTTVEVPFGLTVHYEMQNFVELLGMSPAEAINAATRESARWHGLSDRGTVEIGKRADLLLLNSNPLHNISNSLDIDRVWAFGIEVSEVTRP
jgi:hypothetical protein